VLTSCKAQTGQRAGSPGSWRAHALRVGGHLRQLVAGALGRLAHGDGVAATLAHLVAVQPGQARAGREQRLGLGKQRAADGQVHAPRHLACQLQVGRLVLSDGDPFAAVGEDVGGLQQRVAEQAVTRVAGLLLAEARHALQPGQRRVQGQQREQLGVLGHAALDEERGAGRVDAGGQPVEHHLVDRFFAGHAGTGARHGVPVGNEEQAVVRGLQLQPAAQHAVEMAQVQRAGRSHAADHAGRGGRGRGGGVVVLQGGGILALPTLRSCPS
jgi:hypothetical protein